MAGTRKPAVAARQSAKALLAQRHARQLAEQRLRMQADEADLGVFDERQRDIDTADATLETDLARAARRYDRDLTTAVSELRSALDQGATNETSGDTRRAGVAEQTSLAAFGDALDQAAAIHRAAALAAATRRAATTMAACKQQGDVLFQLRSRGMSVADIAAATTLSAARVSRLIKHRSTAADGSGGRAPASPSSAAVEEHSVISDSDHRAPVVSSSATLTDHRWPVAEESDDRFSPDTFPSASD